MRKKIFVSSTSARIMNGLPGTSPGQYTFARESSSATSKARSRTGRRRFSSIAVAVIAPRWSPTIFKKWVTSTWFPWTAVGGDGQGRGFQSRNQRLRSLGKARRSADHGRGDLSHVPQADGHRDRMSPDGHHNPKPRLSPGHAAFQAGHSDPALRDGAWLFVDDARRPSPSSL